MPMLEGQNRVTIPDLNNKNDLEMEVNWSPSTNDAIKVKLGGCEAVIKRKDLFGFMFVVATPEQQEMLMPVRKTTMTTYNRQHKVVAKRQIEKGQELVVNCQISVPTIVEEGLRQDIFGRKSSILRV